MSAVALLLSEFIDAWHAGERPDVGAFLARAADAESRDELRVLLDAWLTVAPTPDYNDGALAEIAAEPALAAALAAAAAQRTPVAERVRSLREQAGLAVREVASRLAAAFTLPDEERVAGYLQRLEAGELDEQRLSRRLLGALGEAFGAGPGMLDPAPAGAGQALFRADGAVEQALHEEIDALSRAVFAAAPGDGMDDTDRLFCGGPDA